MYGHLYFQNTCTHYTLHQFKYHNYCFSSLWPKMRECWAWSCQRLCAQADHWFNEDQHWDSLIDLGVNSSHVWRLVYTNIQMSTPHVQILSCNNAGTQFTGEACWHWHYYMRHESGSEYLEWVVWWCMTCHNPMLAQHSENARRERTGWLWAYFWQSWWQVAPCSIVSGTVWCTMYRVLCKMLCRVLCRVRWCAGCMLVLLHILSSSP